MTIRKKGYVSLRSHRHRLFTSWLSEFACAKSNLKFRALQSRRVGHYCLIVIHVVRYVVFVNYIVVYDLFVVNMLCECTSRVFFVYLNVYNIEEIDKRDTRLFGP